MAADCQGGMSLSTALSSLVVKNGFRRSRKAAAGQVGSVALRLNLTAQRSLYGMASLRLTNDSRASSLWSVAP
jgi:hypothetical protein